MLHHSRVFEPRAQPGAEISPPPPAGERRVYPITDLLLRPDFPQSALGEDVDIGGFSGTIVEIVRHSIRVRPREGATMGYNVNVLRKLYGPRPPEEDAKANDPAEVATVAPPPPPREIIDNPQFTSSPKPIEEFVAQPGFPKCAYGQHLDFHGYDGVVVEIVNRSLKVRSQQGSTRSYNADGLARLYGKKPPAT